MSADHALALLLDLFKVTLVLVGPLLGAALVAGVLVGILQTATQVNESSVGYVVKVVAAVATLLVFGPMMAEKVVSYTRASLESVANVVR
jgi:flagellar biosynthetic protein FliQ